MESNKCKHDRLHILPSEAAEQAGYKWPNEQKRLAATISTGRYDASKTDGYGVSSSLIHSFFPAPLVLPGDDLHSDPTCPPQSLLSWSRLKDRNEVTEQRKTVYVASLSSPDKSVAALVDTWSKPPTTRKGQEQIPVPSFNDILEYLQAFYHGIPVKKYPGNLKLEAWDGSSSTSPKYVGLTTSDEVIGIRTRPTPDGLTRRQLNLNDLLDALLAILPDDAYSILLLVDIDIYESDDDDFCCGRAFGGSRIAVVSTARYHPLLDEKQDVDRHHSWPSSHCAEYVANCVQDGHLLKKRKRDVAGNPEESKSKDYCLRSAIEAEQRVQPITQHSTPQELSGLWLGRVCKTASHELGHCFGLEHCVYYTCVMQGTCSMAEDMRQPPYLCPVDLAKIIKATGEDMKSRYLEMMKYCSQRKHIHLFSAYEAFLNDLMKMEFSHLRDASGF